LSSINCCFLSLSKMPTFGSPGCLAVWSIPWIRTVSIPLRYKNAKQETSLSSWKIKKIKKS
jgi:hypothetical protein